MKHNKMNAVQKIYNRKDNEKSVQIYSTPGNLHALECYINDVCFTIQIYCNQDKV